MGECGPGAGVGLAGSPNRPRDPVTAAVSDGGGAGDEVSAVTGAGSLRALNSIVRTSILTLSETQSY